MVTRKKSGIHTSTYAQTVYHHGSAMDHTYRKKTMNANELAELIEHLENAKYIGASKAATMLRQQQAEIEALKKEAALQRLSDFTQEAEKTLTDEEIIELFENPDDFNCIDFARAILRKAQE